MINKSLASCFFGINWFCRREIKIFGLLIYLFYQLLLYTVGYFFLLNMCMCAF